jgi:hypothetical protein
VTVVGFLYSSPKSPLLVSLALPLRVAIGWQRCRFFECDHLAIRLAVHALPAPLEQLEQAVLTSMRSSFLVISQQVADQTVRGLVIYLQSHGSAAVSPAN